MIARCLTGMVIIANKPLFYVEMVQQFAGDTGILTSYRCDATQRRNRAQGYIAQIANRGGNNVQSGRERRIHTRLMDCHEESVK